MEARQVRGLARPAFQEGSPGACVQARGFEPAEESLCEQEFPTKPSTDFPGKNHLQPVWPGGWCVQLSTGVCDVGTTVGGIHRPVASYCPVPPAVLSPVPDRPVPCGTPPCGHKGGRPEGQGVCQSCPPADGLRPEPGEHSGVTAWSGQTPKDAQRPQHAALGHLRTSSKAA